MASEPQTVASSTARSSWRMTTRTQVATRVRRSVSPSTATGANAVTARKLALIDAGRARPQWSPAARSAIDAR